MNTTAEVYLWGTRIGIIHQDIAKSYASFEYDTSFSQLSKGKPDRTAGVVLHKNSRIYKKYKKFFKGVSL